MKRLFQFVNKRKNFFKLFIITVALFFVTSFFYFHNSFPQGDEPHYLIISQTILKYHSVYVMKDYTNHDYYAFYPWPINYQVELVGKNYLSQRRIGGPILWLPFFALWGRLGAIFFMSFVSVLIVINIYLLLRECNIQKSTAYLVSLSYAVASPLYIYTHLTFVEPIGALFVLYTFRKVVMKRPLRKYEIILSSILIGITPFVHIRFGLLVAPIFIFLILKILREKGTHWLRLGLLLMPVLVFFGLLEWFTFTYFHSLNLAAPEIINGEKWYLQGIPVALFGLFFDEGFGLIFNFPIFIFFILGVTLTLQARIYRYSLLVLGVCFVYIVVITSYPDWVGGWAPPVRYLLVILPLFSFYIAYLLQHLRNFITWGIYKVFMVIGFISAFFTMYAPSLGFNVTDGINHTLYYFQVHLGIDLTRVFPSVFKPNQGRKFLVWIAILVVLMAFIASSKKIIKFIESH